MTFVKWMTFSQHRPLLHTTRLIMSAPYPSLEPHSLCWPCKSCMPSTSTASLKPGISPRHFIFGPRDAFPAARRIRPSENASSCRGHYDLQVKFLTLSAYWKLWFRNWNSATMSLKLLECWNGRHTGWEDILRLIFKIWTQMNGKRLLNITL